jgi:hypothetical protein
VCVVASEHLVNDVVGFRGRATDTGDDHSLERRSCYNAEVGRPSFERQQEGNREYKEDEATHRICKTICIFLLKLVKFIWAHRQPSGNQRDDNNRKLLSGW